jgi:uncharacterized membrane protein
MSRYRHDWVESVLKRGERIMAVQALRNLIMTNTFLASTMLLVIAFLANFVVGPGRGAIHAPDQVTLFTGDTPVEVKGALLLVLYTFAFVMFLTSLRTLNHLTILVGVEPDQIQGLESREPVRYLGQKLNQVELMTTYGRRAVYYSLPLFAWFYSPWLFAVLAVAIWVFFVLITDFVRPLDEPAAAPESKSPSTGLPK